MKMIRLHIVLGTTIMFLISSVGYAQNYKIADEIISIYGVKTGNYDNVSACRYEVPDYWTIGEVYERLIEDICAENNDIDYIIDVLIKVYTSWMDKAISNYNTDFFYQSREYIFASWQEGKILQDVV